MASISTTAITIVGVIIGYYSYFYFHEYTHWVAGKLFSGDPNVLYHSWYGISYPYAVEFRELEKMPNWGVRIAGISPHIVWTTVAAFHLSGRFSSIYADPFLMVNGIAQGMLSTPLPILILIIASVSAGVSVSPADLVATFYPRRYREYTGRGLSHKEWGSVFVGQID